jgi:hypothetical protein
MALRASAEVTGNEVDASAVTDPAAAERSGVAHAAELLAFADAVVAGDDASAMATARDTLQKCVTDEQLVDVAAVASNFQRMVRIADSTGIPVDAPMDLLSSDMRAELGIDAFGSAANTPPSGTLRRAIGSLLRPYAIPLMRRASQRMRSQN